MLSLRRTGVDSVYTAVVCNYSCCKFYGRRVYLRMDNERLNEIGSIILDAAITVHRELGPGLLESAYQLELKKEWELRGLEVWARVPVEFFYKDEFLGKT